MSIEKSLYEAPQGLSALAEEEPDIEIEIETPDTVMLDLDDGGMEIALIPDSMMAENIPFEANLAEFVSEDVLQSLGDEIVGDVESDITSRKEWSDTFVEGLDLLGIKHEERGEPWDGADWVPSLEADGLALRWSTTEYEIDPAANALRWGTTYNFRFVTNVPPAAETLPVTLGYFKPGFPESGRVNMIAPAPCNGSVLAMTCCIKPMRIW